MPYWRFVDHSQRRKGREALIPILRAWTQEIVILMVLATVVDLALPSGAMKKYVEYAVSLMLLLLLLTPVTELLTGEGELATMLASANLQTRGVLTPLAPLSAQSTWVAYELLLEDRIVAIARSESQVIAAQAEVSFDRDRQSPTFGRPTRVLLILQLQQDIQQRAADEILTRLRAELEAAFGLHPTQVAFRVAR